MKFPASQALHAYWSSLCQGRRAPERNDLDPAAMRDVLPQTFLLEVDGDKPDARQMPIRLSGTRIDALFNRELRGAPFVDLWSVSDHALLRLIAADVLDEAAPAVIGGAIVSDGLPDIGFELLLLPLRHLGRTHARMLGSLVMASTPTWIGLQPAGLLTVKSWRLLEQQRIDRGDRLAERADTYDRRPRLTIYDGGRSVVAAAAPLTQAHVKPVLSRWGNRR